MEVRDSGRDFGKRGKGGEPGNQQTPARGNSRSPNLTRFIIVEQPDQETRGINGQPASTALGVKRCQKRKGPRLGSGPYPGRKGFGSLPLLIPVEKQVESLLFTDCRYGTHQVPLFSRWVKVEGAIPKVSDKVKFKLWPWERISAQWWTV